MFQGGPHAKSCAAHHYGPGNHTSSSDCLLADGRRERCSLDRGVQRAATGASKNFVVKCTLHEIHKVKAQRQKEQRSWIVLISQHVKCGRSKEALKVYEQMRDDGVEVTPLAQTFIILLKACSNLRDLNTARKIHADAISSGLERNLYVATMLIDVYAKCGNLVDARRVFEKMPRRDAVSWTAMILGCVQMDQAEEALQLYTRMHEEGVEPDARTYVGILKACSRLAESADMKKCDSILGKKRCLQTVTAIHADIIEKRGYESDVFVGNMLVVAYAKCGSLENARLVFDKMSRRDVVSWNAIISGYSQMGKGEEALQLYTRMQKECVTPDSWTYVGVLKGCCSLAEVQGRVGDHDAGMLAVSAICLETVRSIHADVKKANLESSLFVGNVLVDVYARYGSLEDARVVFERMPRRDVVSWNAMILGYAYMNKGEEALFLYSRMQQEGVVADSRTYVAALKACSSLAEAEREIDGERVGVNRRRVQTVRAIHSSVGKTKLAMEVSVFIGTALVDAYAKCGSMDEARRVFDAMPCRDVVSWTALIVGYAQVDKGDMALQLYSQMLQLGVVPDARTYVGALNACGSLAALEKGKEIHSQIMSGTGPQGLDDFFLTDSLIDMYGKCGSMRDALRVFESMPTRTTVAWNALISGYAHLGESELVFDTFHRMEREGAQANAVTFLAVLTVCSHVGMVERGQSYFMLMSTNYGIAPTMKHFACVIDLLGRAGELDKATKMVESMPCMPNNAVWRSILAACRKWGDLERARRIFERAVELNTADAATFVLMANIYAAAAMPEEAKKTQARRVQLGAWKRPGLSRWTDSWGIVHTFAVSDPSQHPFSHSQLEGVHAKLADLLIRMKKQGYVPQLDSVLRDIPEEQKELALCGHSERLAIAYALLNAHPQTTIRVVKNLRVCEDCHTAIAFISSIEQRTIICRDTIRFHVFKDGKCSCAGYW